MQAAPVVMAMVLFLGPVAGISWGGEHSGEYDAKFYGTVSRIPGGIFGVWIVSGREVLVTNDTVFREKHGRAAVGAYVEIKGKYSGKEFSARMVEVKKAGH